MVKGIFSDGYCLENMIYGRKHKSKVGIVCCHGFLADMSGRTGRYARSLAKEGFLTVAFNMRGHGKSDKQRIITYKMEADGKEYFIFELLSKDEKGDDKKGLERKIESKEGFFSLETNVRDIKAVIDYITEKEGIEQIMLFCSSSSAPAGLEVAGTDKRVIAAALMSPYTNINNIILKKKMLDENYKNMLEKGENIALSVPWIPEKNISILAYSGRQHNGALSYSGFKETDLLKIAKQHKEPLRDKYILIVGGVNDAVVRWDSIKELGDFLEAEELNEGDNINKARHILVALDTGHSPDEYEKRVAELTIDFFCSVREQKITKSLI